MTELIQAVIDQLERLNNCLWFLLIPGILSSCSPQSMPPGAYSIGGSFEGALYYYHYWEEGLAILIWHDFSFGESGCRGTSSSEDPMYRLTCNVEAQDGRRFNWEVHTRNGVTAQMWIDEESYDLAQGSMFLVSSQNGETNVVQLKRDLSGLDPDKDTLSALANRDRHVATFIEKIRSE